VDVADRPGKVIGSNPLLFCCDTAAEILQDILYYLNVRSPPHLRPMFMAEQSFGEPQDSRLVGDLAVITAERVSMMVGGTFLWVALL
jgi:hypothetical protein